MAEITSAFHLSDSRLLLIDYDGTLVPFYRNPDEAVASQEVKQAISKLCNDPANMVCIISGRSSAWLEAQFGLFPINLIAEHGAVIKCSNQDWIVTPGTHKEWKRIVRDIMEPFVLLSSNSFIEEKDFSIVWHYRNVEKEFGIVSAELLINQLNTALKNLDLQILPGNKIIEVRQCGINKGSFIKSTIKEKHFEFILAIGDDRTDEDMFDALEEKKHAFTIKVGAGVTSARYGVEGTQQVLELLQALSRER